MTQARIGKWGDALAVRIPPEIARAAQITEGEKVDIVACGGDILIRFSGSAPVAAIDEATCSRAQRAVEEIIKESKNYSLGGISIREMIDEGRR